MMTVTVTPRHLPDGPDGMPAQLRPECAVTFIYRPGHKFAIIGEAVTMAMRKVQELGYDPHDFVYELVFRP